MTQTVIGRASKLLTSLNRPYKRLLLLLVDVIGVVIAYVFTLAVQDQVEIVPTLRDSGLVIVPLVMAITAGTATLLKLPNIRLKSYDVSGMGRVALMAVFVALANAMLHVAADAGLSAGTFVVFAIVFFLFAAAARVVMLDLLLRMYRAQGTRRRVLIYGAGTTGMQLARALATHETIEPVAFVDDNAVLQGLSVAGLVILRPVDIPQIVEEKRVNRVLLAMPSLSHPKQTKIARRLESQGLEVQALPSFAQLIGEEALLDKMVTMQPARFLGRKAVQHAPNIGCDHLMDRAVLVSGGGGSIGLELCRQTLVCKPAKLVILEISELALYEAEKALAPLADEVGTEIVPILVSVTEPRVVRRIMTDHGIQVVLHAAAYKHVPIVEHNPLVGLANNVLGTWTLGRAAREAGVERFMLISSDKAVRPTNIMGASKRMAEMVVQDLAERSPGTIFSMVRFGNVLGSSGSVVPLFQEQIANGGPVTVTDAEVTRFFMTQQEAVSLVLLATSFASGGEVFVLDMGKAKRIVDLARQCIEDAGYTVRDAAAPDGDIEIQITGLRPGEKLHEELLIGEGHLTTAHEKIFAAREACLSEIEIASAIRALREAVATGDDLAARAIVARWVEGYVAPAVPDVVETR